MTEKNKSKNFELFIHRRHLARFICRYELFKRILDIEGSIIECGVHNGSGLLSFAKLSEIFEPYGIKRKIIGFDTFKGFTEINNPKDKNSKSQNIYLNKKSFNLDQEDLTNINQSIKEFENDRYLKQYPKIEIIKGDAVKTIPKFISKNKHLIIALLFIDFDVYKPTKIALKHFLPLMPQGSILAFDEINNESWPGETAALMEEIGDIKKIKIEKFHFDSNISYITF